MNAGAIRQAFVLGAGLGTRLRPLTDELPKPLVPVFQKPLITFAFDHLISVGCTKLIVNTHHCADAYGAPEQHYRDVPVQYRYEPDLLETGGGIANVADLLGDKPFIVYNGDILTDLPIERLVDEHRMRRNLVTLGLRSAGGPQHVSFDPQSGSVIDIRNRLGTGARDEFVFSGVYVCDPQLMRWLEPGVKRSVIPMFLEMIRAGARVGGAVVDEGYWWDVGTPVAYLELHRELRRLDFPRSRPGEPNWRAPIHDAANVEADAQLTGCSVVGENAHVGAEAELHDTIVWSGAQIASRSRLRNCIVRRGKTVEGDFSDTVI